MYIVNRQLNKLLLHPAKKKRKYQLELDKKLEEMILAHVDLVRNIKIVVENNNKAYPLG